MIKIYDVEVKDINLETINMSVYKGKTLLIVNVASACGFTPQYKGLQELYEKYKDKNFEILAFPCNQFGAQESGTNEEIASFCDTSFGVSFKIFDKVNVNGDDASPLFRVLTKEFPGILGTENIKWNFTKFLINKDGEIVERFGSTKTPEAIEEALSKII
ncbi:glutathione peroxidase [Gammaproteobacteria bacterium]|jgi:glutathione peroxidase|nr:glutathione peroxidase [Gammaproteobacteria bacterium]MDB9996780.1 glutathione peroxidase [Gammaproteobacteria bacterium]MDC1191040.1 glutathione peroxidase [Gammaproteobacteria bacterium]|tara:strand:+ start:698 stop:1177 length:480 start_codon:yes stop_codon:yes gene_type:complete